MIMHNKLTLARLWPSMLSSSGCLPIFFLISTSIVCSDFTLEENMKKTCKTKTMPAFYIYLFIYECTGNLHMYFLTNFLIPKSLIFQYLWTAESSLMTLPHLNRYSPLARFKASTYDSPCFKALPGNMVICYFGWANKQVSSRPHYNQYPFPSF